MNKLWQQLWEKSEDSSNIFIKPLTIDLPDLGLSVKGKWNPNPQPDCPSFPIGSEIYYEITLSNSGYLIVSEKSASGEIYCLAPSNLSPAFPVSWGSFILPKDDVFTVEGPIGYEEIIAVFSEEEPQLDWLPQAEDDPLELQREHLASLLSHVNQNKCDLMRIKYLMTD